MWPTIETEATRFVKKNVTSGKYTGGVPQPDLENYIYNIALPISQLGLDLLDLSSHCRDT